MSTLLNLLPLPLHLPTSVLHLLKFKYIYIEVCATRGLANTYYLVEHSLFILYLVAEESWTSTWIDCWEHLLLDV